MRVGAMVVGILFAIWTFFEALLLTGLSNASNDGKTSSAAGFAVVAAIFCGVAAALVLAVPFVSAILFAIAAVFSFSAAGMGYGNHWLYGSVFAALGAMAFFGWIGKRKERREVATEKTRQLDRDARLEALMLQQRVVSQSLSPSPPNPVVFPNFCPACHARNEQGGKFCGECGRSLAHPSA